MKAVFIRKTGPYDVLEYGDMPMPEINDNEVLVKVSAVACNPIDTYIRSGKYPINRPFPYIIGRDMVGTVENFGKNVTHFEKGQRVWSNSMGTHNDQGSFSEYVSCHEDYLYKAPDNVDDTELVGAVQPVATAYIGLIWKARIKPEDVIYVNGGAGTVGSSVIQLARWLGAFVYTATSGEEKSKWCTECGADLVLDYKKDDIVKEVLKKSPEGVNLVWDTSQNPNFDLSVSLLSQKGKIILMAGADARPVFPVGPFYQKECTMYGFTLTKASQDVLKESAELINILFDEKKIRVKVYDVLSLQDASKAHFLLENDKNVWGKIVLKVT